MCVGSQMCVSQAVRGLKEIFFTCWHIGYTIMRTQKTFILNFACGFIVGTMTMMIMSTVYQNQKMELQEESLRDTEVIPLEHEITDELTETVTIEDPLNLNQISENYTDTTDHWTLVREGPHLFYIFSAFFDKKRQFPRIRIAAAGEMKITEPSARCILTYTLNGVTTKRSVRADVSNVNVWLKRYLHCGKMIECNLPTQDRPSHVSIDLGTGTLPNQLKIHNDVFAENRKNRLCACVKPMYNFNSQVNATSLIEFMEFYKILGIQHFYFYVQSATQWILLLLQKYEQQGDVTIVPMDLPPSIVLEGVYQYSVNTDCILRARPRFALALFIDIDEFIIPRRHTNLVSLVRHFDAPKITAFHFITVFFNVDLPDDLEADNPAYTSKLNYNFASGFPFKLRTQLKVYRTPEFLFFKDRNKCIVKTDYVEQMGVHSVTNYTISHRIRKRIDPDNGVVQHYRQKLPEGLPKEPDWPWPTVDEALRDTTAHQYGQRLIQNIYNTVKKFGL